jgi:hypothetical protein
MKRILLATAIAALLVTSAASADPHFDPFLYCTDMDSSYQGSGWINRDCFLAVMKSRAKETQN